MHYVSLHALFRPNIDHSDTVAQARSDLVDVAQVVTDLARLAAQQDNLSSEPWSEKAELEGTYRTGVGTGELDSRLVENQRVRSISHT